MKWWGICLVLFLFCASSVYALALQITDSPSGVDQSQEFTVKILLSCTSCSDSFLRGVFFKSGTNYFGFTKNNSGIFVNLPGSQAQEYFKVGSGDMSSGSWSGELVLKPDPGDKAYTGPGDYSLKVGRYTAGGSVTWSEPVALTISGPSPTPLPPTSAPTPKPSSTPKPVLLTSASPPVMITPPDTPDTKTENLILPEDIFESAPTTATANMLATSAADPEIKPLIPSGQTQIWSKLKPAAVIFVGASLLALAIFWPLKTGFLI